MAAPERSTRVNLVLDEMLPKTLAEQLRERGHDAVAVTERPAWRGTSDRRLIELAWSDGRAIVTYNLEDFLRLTSDLGSRGTVPPGLVLLSSRRFPDSQPATFGRLLRSLEALLEDPPAWPGFVHWLRRRRPQPIGSAAPVR